MCLAMNPDKLKPEERCASTSNRNFEGRQGFKGRTHLVSPTMAAAAAIAGHFVDIREWRGGTPCPHLQAVPEQLPKEVGADQAADRRGGHLPGTSRVGEGRNLRSDEA